MALVPFRSITTRIAVVSGVVCGSIVAVPYTYQMIKMNRLAQDTQKLSTELGNTKKDLEKNIYERDNYYRLYKDTSLKLDHVRNELQESNLTLKLANDAIKEHVHKHKNIS